MYDLHAVRAIKDCMDTISRQVFEAAEQLSTELTDAQAIKWTTMMEFLNRIVTNTDALLDNADGVTAINYMSHHLLVSGLHARIFRTTLPGWSSHKAFDASRIAFHTSSALYLKLGSEN
jgi:hypothetical protein